MPILPFKLNQERRHHFPRQQRKVTNPLGALLRSWPAYDASLRQRGSLTVWFTDEAIAGWAADARATRGGQPCYSPLAILTALTLHAVFRLAYRQTEGLIGSIVALLGIALSGDMISRTWRGWTTLDNADKYDKLLRITIFPGILMRDIPGFNAIELGRRAQGEEVEFLTTMWFQSWDAVKQFAGSDWEISVVPPAARTLLTRFDEKAQHYEIQERRSAAAVRPTALDTTIKPSMGMGPRLSIVTLGVTDLACASAFYEGLGWPRKVRGAVGVAFFQLNGVGLLLYPRAALAADAGVPLQTAPSQGLTLAYNTRSRDEVDAVLARAGALGGRITCSAQDAVWGGYHGHFADPEGFLWEIAWNPGFALTADGVLNLPE